MGKRGPKRDHVKKALKDAHLYAIGKVAAQWSRLEGRIMVDIATLAKIPTEKAIAFLAPTGFYTWCDLYGHFLSRSPDHDEGALARWKELRKTLDQLSAERNRVVHALWIMPKDTRGIINAATQGELPPPERAEGYTFPKKGGRGISLVIKTPAEIRDIAAQINKARFAIGKVTTLKKGTAAVEGVKKSRTSRRHSGKTANED